MKVTNGSPENFILMVNIIHEVNKMELRLDKVDTIDIESVHLNPEHTEYKYQPLIVISIDSNTKSND